MNTVAQDDRIGVDLEPVASFVPVDDRVDIRARGIHVTPVLVLHALLERSGDARRRSEVHVGDAHADSDVLFAISAYLLIPFDAIGPDTAIDRVEAVLG